MTVGSGGINVGTAGAVIATNHGSVSVTHHYEGLPCPGPSACPHRSGPVGSPDAKDENEFYKDTGIRTGPMGRKLLNELQARHGLKWRGSGSILRCWHHETIGYIDGDQALRIVPDWFNWAYGWALFALGVICEIGVAVVTTSKTASDWSVLVFASGLLFMWYSAEHMISPTNIARRLLKKEKATCGPI